jgi:hypothetical protein
VRKTAIMKYVVFVFLMLIGYNGAIAQEIYNSSGKANYKTKKKNTGYDPDKLVVGGGITLAFGNGYANLGASPIVGYRFFKKFSAGIGVGYQYYKYPSYLDPYNNVYNSYMNIIYPNVWARYFVYRNIFVTGNFEYDFISRKDPLDRYGNLNQTKKSVTNQCFLVGVGGKQPLGGRVSFYGELFYDVLQGEYSPYPKNSPGLRFGIAAGL